MNNKLNLELATEYYKLAYKASASSYALLAVTLYFFWGKIPASILLPWTCINGVTATAFLVAARRFKQHGTAKSATRWLRIYAYLVLFHDAPWGLIGPMSFMVNDEVYRMLTLFMLGGMAAGAITTRALVFRTYVITLFSLLTPIIVTLALQGTAVTNGMLVLALIYLVFMLSVAKSYSASFSHNIKLWLNNEKLVDQLRKSHAEVEAVNRTLSGEIEQRKNVERELLEAKERSERANEAKSQFLANVSHELRTPLNAIMGFTDLLEDESLEKSQMSHVRQISKAAGSLLHIVNDILDITAIEAGHISFHDEPFSLRSEMDDLLAMLRPMAESKKLMLQMHVEEGVEDALSGDANRLRQIVGNLLSNALKYTEEGRVNLTIRRLEAPNGEILLRFEIEDTGIGIAAESLNTIFENFTRVESFETRRNEGTGLGLAIVKTLVRKMNGKLAVRSMQGKGSCFSIELAFGPGGEIPLKAEHTQAPGLIQVEWRDFHVLVVDDNEINRMALSAFLTKAGIPFVTASNGYEALEQIRAGGFDIVLLDIQMPGISGIDVANRLRGELASVPVMIAVTAHAFPEQRQAILDAGFSDFIIKPIVRDDLMKTLTQAYAVVHNEREASTQNLLVSKVHA